MKARFQLNHLMLHDYGIVKNKAHIIITRSHEALFCLSLRYFIL